MDEPEADLLERLFDRYLELDLEGHEDAAEQALAEAPDEATRQALRRQIELDRRVLAAVPDVLDANQRLGSYRLIEEVARGGQGIVYRAEQPSLGRDVAIKVLPPDRSHSREHRKKLAEESRLLGGLQHPAIVFAIELLVTDRGLCLVMSYLPFPSMQRLLEVAAKEGLPPLQILARHCAEAGSAARDPVQLCCKLVETAARGLDAAHRAGVLHGDVKPSNLLVGKDGHPYLIDFGLATLQGPRAEEGIRVHGTLPYVAPEVLQQGHSALSPASDVFGLAATCYELLCGEPIFRADRFLELLRQARDERVPSLRTRRRNLPPELDLILRRALERDPKQRTPSALAFADDLARFREGRALDTRGEPLGTRVHLAWRVARQRHRLWIGAGVAALLAVLVAWWTWPAGTTAQAVQELGQRNYQRALELFRIAESGKDLDLIQLTESLPLLEAARDAALLHKDHQGLDGYFGLICKVRSLAPEELRQRAKSRGLTVAIRPVRTDKVFLLRSNNTGEIVYGADRQEFEESNDGLAWCALEPGHWRVCFGRDAATGLFPSYLVRCDEGFMRGNLELRPLWPYADEDKRDWAEFAPLEGVLGQSFTDPWVDSFCGPEPYRVKVQEPYYLQRSEFSWSRYQRFVQSMEEYVARDEVPPFAHPDDPRPFDSIALQARRGPDSKPIGFCNFYDAFAIATWAYARLPTEPEWELAARRGRPDSDAFSFDLDEDSALSGVHGPSMPNPDLMDLYSDASNDPLPVGASGLLHLYDNVGEFTSTIMRPHPGGRMKTDFVSVVVKGYLRDKSPDAVHLNRGLVPPWARYPKSLQRSKSLSWYGFRLACSPAPTR